ncbi:MAG: M48 family metalloprotease [Proteobacteria bacterium]|nr:M48 family metalloprotease [Pseudomonadota bacterium]
MSTRIFRPAIVLASALALVACGTLTPQEEKSLGRQVQSQVRRQLTLVRDADVVNYIRDMGEELARSAGPSAFDIKFYVVEDENLNAFAVPGGAIYIHTGLIEAVNSADELAGVVAHEIGHVTARHTAQLYRRQRNTAIASQLAGAVVGAATGSRSAADAGGMAAAMAGQGYITGYTREFERESDRLAVATLIEAGWDPTGMLRMFQTLQKESKGGTLLTFLSSHPATDERIANVKAQIAAHGTLGELRQNDRKLELIQRKLELTIGADSGADPLDEEDLEDADLEDWDLEDEDLEDAEDPEASSP